MVMVENQYILLLVRKSRQLRLLLDPLEGRQNTLYLKLYEDDLCKIRESKSLICSGLAF